MAVWTRNLGASFAGWLNKLPRGQLPDGRVLVDAHCARQALRSIFRASSTPDHACRKALEEDVMALVRYFIQLVGSEKVDIRLEKVESDACWKFHFDNVPFRLLTTYRGETTQWIEPEYETAALKLQRQYSGPLHSLPPYAVAVFKGTQAMDGQGVLHRSPPIGQSGQIRLLLCLNFPSPASPEFWLHCKSSLKRDD